MVGEHRDPVAGGAGTLDVSGGKVTGQPVPQVVRDYVTSHHAEDPEAIAHLEAFFELEDRLMAEGVIDSDFVTVTAVRD